MPRKNDNARSGGNSHGRNGAGWMKSNKGTAGKKRRKKSETDGAPLTPGTMHPKRRLARRNR